MALVWQAEAHAMLGQPGEGLQCPDPSGPDIDTDLRIDTTRQRCIGCGETCWVSPVTCQRPSGSYSHAIAVARSQSAKLFQLRASTSLARLWRNQGKHVEARDLLGPIYGWFTEGFDAPDLNDAKSLLDELARRRQTLQPAVKDGIVRLRADARQQPSIKTGRHACRRKASDDGAHCVGCIWHPALAAWSGFEQPSAGLCTFGSPLPERYAALIISGRFEVGAGRAKPRLFAGVLRR